MSPYEYVSLSPYIHIAQILPSSNSTSRTSFKLTKTQIHVPLCVVDTMATRRA